MVSWGVFEKLSWKPGDVVTAFLWANLDSPLAAHQYCSELPKETPQYLIFQGADTSFPGFYATESTYQGH